MTCTNFSSVLSVNKKGFNSPVNFTVISVPSKAFIASKKYLEQIRITKDVIYSRNHNDNIKNLVKGIMIESYIEDGAQKVCDHVYGKSITDPCLGWEKTEKLIYKIADTIE